MNQLYKCIDVFLLIIYSFHNLNSVLLLINNSNNENQYIFTIFHKIFNSHIFFPDIITTIPKATIDEATTVSFLNTIATLNSISTTIKSSTVARMFSSTEEISRNKKRKEDSRIKKPPKEDFFNHGLGFRGRKIEESSSIITDLKTTTSKSETQLRGSPGWTLKRRPNYVNHEIPSTTSASVNQSQTNQIILFNHLSKNTETLLSNAKVLRRGTKRPKAKNESNIISNIMPKNVTRDSKTFNKSEALNLPKKIELEESDNYPLAFRARLSQLVSLNLFTLNIFNYL